MTVVTVTMHRCDDDGDDGADDGGDGGGGCFGGNSDDIDIIGDGGGHLLVALVLLETLEQGEESFERRPPKLKQS